jgi:hypothetical protein
MELTPNILISEEGGEAKTAASVDFLLAQCFTKARAEYPETITSGLCKNGTSYEYLRGYTSVINPHLQDEDEPLYHTMVRLTKYSNASVDEDHRVRIGLIRLRSPEGAVGKYHLTHDTLNGEYVIEREKKIPKADHKVRWLGVYAMGSRPVVVPATAQETEIIYNSLIAFEPYR